MNTVSVLARTAICVTFPCSVDEVAGISRLFMDIVHTGAGAHPASYSMGAGFFFPEVKQTGQSTYLHPKYSERDLSQCHFVQIVKRVLSSEVTN